MSIQLPKLPYPFDALEPMISKSTLEHHYLKHHQKYVDTLNKLIAGTTYQQMELEDIIIESAHQGSRDKKIFNNAAQVWNHTFYWNSMVPHAKSASTEMKKVIDESFGSLDSFYDQFIKAGTELFGSGYVWVVKTVNGTLMIRSTENAATPITEAQQPIFCCDVWEHAYYLDVQQDRETYLKQFCLLINWKFAEANFHKIPKSNFYTQPTAYGEPKESSLHH